LLGGYVEHFFRVDVPKLELNEDAVFHALFRAAPDPDAILGAPLKSALHVAIDSIAARYRYWSGVAQTRAFVIEHGVERALQQIASAVETPAAEAMNEHE
jgi:hypothetical protein